MAYVSAAVNPSQKAVRVRVQGAQLGQLGILPVVAAAVPSVSQILGKITTSLVSIIDPGKKRDANREARAEMWFQYASAGSITAARRLYGGQTTQYTDKEKAYYRDRWSKFQQANPTLAAQAVQAGGLGIPEPGSDLQPPALNASDLQEIQGEINAYHAAHAAAGTTPPSQPSLNIAQAGLLGGNFSTLILGGALLYAVATKLQKPRRR